jgi:diguanylate cyclase (GGDEF)-like protein
VIVLQLFLGTVPLLHFHLFERAFGKLDALSAFWVRGSVTLVPCLALATIVWIMVFKRRAALQDQQHASIEGELRRERNSLEQRIEARTAELRSEIVERHRAQQLNLGRNRLLEMLTREEPVDSVLNTLVEVVATDRSSFCCALHLIESDALVMKASHGMPTSLLRSLKQLTIDMTDCPEARALRDHAPQVLSDLTKERKPWPHLLNAHGVQSLWSVPIYAAEGSPLGTLTIYSLLRFDPAASDLSLLESHAQTASMALERYRLQEELRRHAYHDNLTGLVNRLRGEEQLESAIRRARRSGERVAVLCLDLDKFKQINDVHGHMAGDAVLREVALRLTGRLRDSDTIARMGGDEFMVVLEGVADKSAAMVVAKQLLDRLKHPVAFQELMLTTAASIGIAISPEDGDTADILKRNADIAMYEAKFGKCGTQAFSSELKSVLLERRELESAMIHSLEHGGFALHYQPQYDINGSLDGFEALLRFSHPVLGNVSPTRLIAVAEESQMIVTLGTWVLREACSQSRRWQLAGFPSVRIAVNISAVQFARPNFAEQVADVLEETGLHAELLELELTESVMVKDFSESITQLERLKRLGVTIAIDDFGTGYSSLSHLHRLPIDKLKIDRSFIQALGERNGTLPIVDSIILMAHRLGIRVLAEGVETADQLTLLREKNCDLLQGYLFSPAIDPTRAGHLLEETVSTLDTTGTMNPIEETTSAATGRAFLFQPAQLTLSSGRL